MYHSNYVGFYYGKGNVRYTPAGILLLCYNASATAFNSVCDDVSRALGEALIELNLATRYEKSDNVQRIVRFAGFNIEVPDNIILGKELEEVIERIYFGFELKMLSSECISYDKYSLVGTNNIGWFEIGYEDPVYSLAGFYLLLYNAYVYNEDVKSLNSKGQCRFFEATCKALVKLGFAECRE